MDYTRTLDSLHVTTYWTDAHNTELIHSNLNLYIMCIKSDFWGWGLYAWPLYRIMAPDTGPKVTPKIAPFRKQKLTMKFHCTNKVEPLGYMYVYIYISFYLCIFLSFYLSNLYLSLSLYIYIYIYIYV